VIREEHPAAGTVLDSPLSASFFVLVLPLFFALVLVLRADFRSPLPAPPTVTV